MYEIVYGIMYELVVALVDDTVAAAVDHVVNDAGPHLALQVPVKAYPASDSQPFEILGNTKSAGNKVDFELACIANGIGADAESTHVPNHDCPIRYRCGPSTDSGPRAIRLVNDSPVEGNSALAPILKLDCDKGMSLEMNCERSDRQRHRTPTYGVRVGEPCSLYWSTMAKTYGGTWKNLTSALIPPRYTQVPPAAQSA